MMFLITCKCAYVSGQREDLTPFVQAVFYIPVSLFVKTLTIQS